MTGPGETVITYRVDPRPPEGTDPLGPPDRIVAAVRAAFAAWDIPEASVRFEYAGLAEGTEALDGRNIVTFRPSSTPPPGFEWAIFPVAYYAGDDVATAALPGSDSARVGTTLDCDLVVHAGGAFTLAESPEDDASVLSLSGILTHEIGHMLGLDHSPIGGSTMYAYATWGSGFGHPTLTADDRMGLASLYPARHFHALHGQVRGQVTDASGEPVSGAHVVAMDAHTGVVVAGAISGLAAEDELGRPDRFSLGSGVYRIHLPPGRYRLLVEPIGHPAQGLPYMSGIYGSASGSGSYIDGTWSPLLDPKPVRVRARDTTRRDVQIDRATPDLPVLDRRQSRILAGDHSRWTSPAAVARGTNVRVRCRLGQGDAQPGRAELSFLGPGITVVDSGPGEDPRDLELALGISSVAPVGLRTLRLQTPAGVSYFPGFLEILPSPATEFKPAAWHPKGVGLLAPNSAGQ
jgi:hypothetical protein